MNNIFRNRDISEFRRRQTPEYLQLGYMPIHIRFKSEEDTTDNTTILQQPTAPGPLSEEHFPTLERTTAKYETNMEQKTQSANANGSPKARPNTKGGNDDFLEEALQVLPGMRDFEAKILATDECEESPPKLSNKKRHDDKSGKSASKDSSKGKEHGHTSTKASEKAPVNTGGTSTKSSTATKQELDENAATKHGAQKEKVAATKQELCNTTTKSDATKQERGNESAATTQGQRSSDNGNTTKSTKKPEAKHRGASASPAMVTIERGGKKIEVPTQPLVNKPTPPSRKEVQKRALALNELVANKIEPFCAKDSPTGKITLTAAQLQAYAAKQQADVLTAAQKKEKAKVTQIETKFQQELVAKEMDRADAEKRFKALQRKSEEDQLRIANLEKIARDASVAQKAPANQEQMHPESASTSSDHKKEERPASAQPTTRSGNSKEQQGEKKVDQHKNGHYDNIDDRGDEHRGRSLNRSPSRERNKSNQRESSVHSRQGQDAPQKGDVKGTYPRSAREYRSPSREHYKGHGVYDRQPSEPDRYTSTGRYDSSFDRRERAGQWEEPRHDDRRRSRSCSNTRPYNSGEGQRSSHHSRERSPSRRYSPYFQDNKTQSMGGTKRPDNGGGDTDLNRELQHLRRDKQRLIESNLAGDQQLDRTPGPNSDDKEKQLQTMVEQAIALALTKAGVPLAQPNISTPLASNQSPLKLSELQSNTIQTPQRKAGIYGESTNSTIEENSLVSSTMGQTLLSDVIRQTNVGKGDNDPVPTGFYGDESIDTISVTVFLNELGTYRATFAQKHSSLSIGQTDQMIVQNILNSWKTARLAINKKHPERGDKKLPVEQQLYDIRALMAETPIEQMTPEQLIDTIKSTFVTSAHITSLEMSFLNLVQGNDSFAEYVGNWSEQILILLGADKQSGFKNNDQKQISHFINGVTDTARREDMRSKVFASTAEMLKYCQTVMKNSNTSKLSIQTRLTLKPPAAVGTAPVTEKRPQQTGGGRQPWNTEQSLQYAVKCFRQALLKKGQKFCMRCLEDTHYLYDRMQNREICTHSKDSTLAVQRRNPTTADAKWGFDMNKCQQYIDEARAERAAKMARKSEDHTSPNSGGYRGPSNIPSRFSEVASSSRNIQMNTARQNSGEDILPLNL